VTALALAGFLMTPLSVLIVGRLFLMTICFALALDLVKRIVFRHIRID